MGKKIIALRVMRDVARSTPPCLDNELLYFQVLCYESFDMCVSVLLLYTWAYFEHKDFFDRKNHEIFVVYCLRYLGRTDPCPERCLSGKAEYTEKGL